MAHTDLHAKTEADVAEKQKNIQLNLGGDKATNKENESPKQQTEYPRNYVQTTSAGHVFEMNNTENGERIRLLHAKGNFLDFDETGNTYMITREDKVEIVDHNCVIKIGKDPKKDKLVIQVIGDAHLYVEGDMHTEVDGNKYEQIGGNYEMKCGGVMLLQADENMAIKAEGKLKIKSNDFTNTATFMTCDLQEGGDSVEKIFGNKTIKVMKPTSTFAIESEGDMRVNAKGCYYQNVGKNMFTDVTGKAKLNVTGDTIKCIPGGAPQGMDATPPTTSSYGTEIGYEIKTGSTSTKISTEDFEMIATGAAKMTAAGEEFKIECNNGIYLN